MSVLGIGYDYHMNFDIYATSDYFDDLITRISKTGEGDKVTLATMILFPVDPMVKRIVEELAAAAIRGANVTLWFDAHTFLILRGQRLGPLFFRKNMPGQVTASFRPAHEAIMHLRRSGVKCLMTNVPGKVLSNPLSGRSHIKFSLINDRVYIGGCNLDRSTNLDVMVAWDDSSTVEWLEALVASTELTGQVKLATGGMDEQHSLDGGESLLLDAGVAGQSIIFDKALQMIDRSKKYVTLTCQFFPNDLTIRHLLAAYNRGVKVKIIYNHPSKHLWPQFALHFAVEKSSKLRLPESFFKGVVDANRPYLHAKILITEEGVMIGSHNYVRAGVSLGTAEIALFSHNTALSRQVEETILKQTLPR